jgi:L(+)-tartrate dehydratase beta subunit
MPTLTTVDLKLPATREELAALTIGTVVYLSGRVHTAREGVYKRAVEERCNVPDGIGSASFHCSPAASVGSKGELTVGAVTATASFRFARWIDGWLERTGCNIVIGKGGMSSKDYRQSFVPHGAIYLTTVGYGTGALLGRGIKKVVAAHWLEEVGIAQAIWVLDVEKFGPFIVESDLEGNSLFEAENARIAPGLGKLYEGSKPAIMRRFGETDDKTDEMI